MSTEAKIKHTEIQADSARWRKEWYSNRSDHRIFAACDHIDSLLAELARNRRLLEVGERLAEAARDEITELHGSLNLHRAHVAYQEAAK